MMLKSRCIAVVLTFALLLSLCLFPCAAAAAPKAPSFASLQPNLPINITDVLAIEPLMGIAFSNGKVLGGSNGVIYPAFTSSVYNYTVMVAKNTAKLRIVPATGHKTYAYTIQVNEATAAVNEPAEIKLNNSETSLVVSVTTPTGTFRYDFLIIKSSIAMLGSEITPSILQSGRAFYYSGKYGLSGMSLLKKTGSTTTKLCNDEPLWIQNVSNVLVYSNAEDNNHLYRISTDGKNRKKIAAVSGYGLKIYNNDLYFSNASAAGSLCRVALNGNDLKVLTSADSHDLHFYNGWVYYINASDNNRIYRVRIDGAGKSPVSADSCTDLRLAGGTLYYSSISDNRALYKLNIDGSGKTKLTNVPSYSLFATNDWVYFGDGSFGSVLSRIGTNGTGRTAISAQIVQTDSIRLAYGYLYVQTEEGILYRIKPDGSDLVANWQP